MATIHVDIVSAEGEIFSGEAAMVFVPAVQGDIGIAPRHAPLLTTLKPGEVRVQLPSGEEQHIYVSGGALEVQPHLITVLADTAIRAKDLDEAAVLQASNVPKKRWPIVTKVSIWVRHKPNWRASWRSSRPLNVYAS
jgi:F-type H+-transporting ATPase subunit epsilon